MGEVSMTPPERLSRDEALRRLQEWIPGVERVLRVLSTPVQYALVVGGQRVELGSVETLLSQRKFRAKVVESLNLLPRWLDQRYWDSMAQAVLDAAEEVEAPEAEELDLLRAWLEAYLEERVPARADDLQSYEAHLRLELPVVTSDGEVAVNAVNMAIWIGDNRGAKIQPRALALLLRRYGAEARKFQVWREGRNRTKRYWIIPSTLLPEWARGLGEELEPSQNPSHIVGSPQQVTRGVSPVQDAKNEGSSHIVGEKIAPTPSQVSDYVTRPEENAVQDGDDGLVTWAKSSDYVTRLGEPEHTSEAEKYLSTQPGGEAQEWPPDGETSFTKKEVGGGKIRLVLDP